MSNHFIHDCSPKKMFFMTEQPDELFRLSNVVEKLHLFVKCKYSVFELISYDFALN